MPRRAPGSLRPGALAAALLACVWLPHPAGAQVGIPLVSRVRFEGNESFSSDSLARAIATRETECRSAVILPFCAFGADFAIRRAFFAPRELPRDMLRLQIWYRRRGFRETRVDTATTSRDDGKVEVTFRIVEGRPVLVDSLEFSGAEEFEGTDLLDGLPLQKGGRLSTVRMDATRDTLVRRLANRGHATAEVLRSFFIPRADPYRASVTFDVAPGPRARYGRVTVDDNQKLSDATVRRTVQFAPGDLYRVDLLVEAQARLFGLDIVRSAQITPDFSQVADSVVPVRVRVEEGDVHRVRAGSGWTNEECLDTEARWVSRNFVGGGRRLQLRARVSNLGAEEFGDVLCPSGGDGVFAETNWLVSSDLVQPWVFSTRNSFQTAVFAERQSLQDVFVRRAVGVSVGLTRALDPRTPVTLAYRPERSRLDAAEALFCSNFLVCAPEDIGALSGDNWLSPIALNLIRNQANDLLNPSRGYTAILDVEHAAPWTGSDFRYDRVVGEVTHYSRPGAGPVVLALRGRAGWVGAGEFGDRLTREGSEDGERIDVVHPQKRFYAGGANSVRGFAQNRLGPRVLTADVRDLLAGNGARCRPDEIVDATCDASGLSEGRLTQRPTGGTRLIEGSAELRLGVGPDFQVAAFTDFGRVWAGGETADLRSLEMTPGVGFRYLSPIGPIRLDLAYSFRGGENLPVVTTQLRPFDPDADRPEDRLTVDGVTIPWVATDRLAVLGPRVFFGDSSTASLSRVQLHISIGQAF